MYRVPLGLQLIEERKARELQKRYLDEANMVDVRARQKSLFEETSNRRFRSAEMKRRADHKYNCFLENLDERREELKQLFDEEDLIYKREILQNYETIDDRKRKLREKILRMKEEQKREHDELVAQKLEQGWRDNCDELRRHISKQLVMNVAKDREKQLIEKDIMKEQEQMEDERWAEYVRHDVGKNNEDQKYIKDDLIRKKSQNKKAWISQIERKNDSLEKEKEADRLEGIRLQQIKEDEERRIEQKKKEISEGREKMKQELDKMHTYQIRRKQREKEREKEEDYEFARENAEKLRQEEEQRLVNFMRKKQTAEEDRKLIDDQRKQKVKSDKDAEKFHEFEQRKKNQQEDEVRHREETLRKNLMLDAVAHRVRTMKIHEVQKEQKKEDKIREGLELEADLEKKRQLDEEEADLRRRRIQSQYDMIAQQCKLKRELAKQRKDEEDLEVQMRIADWKAEDEKIKETMKDPNLINGTRFRGFR